MNTSCFVVCGLPLYHEDGDLRNILAAHFKQPANGGVNVLNMIRGPISGTALVLISDDGDDRKWMFKKKHRLDSLGPFSNIPLSLEQLTPEFEPTVMRQMTEGLGLQTRYWEQVPRGPAYEMCHQPRGLAIIVNNINFRKGHKTRTGAEQDTERLRELFEGLKFTVRCYKDMTHQDMMTTLEHVAEEDHSNFDCFICCVMSHGAQGKVYSSDGFPIEISLLLKPFNAKECPSLVGKPKLFFIQACQGVHIQERVCVDCAFDADAVLHVSQEADFFVGLPTVPGCVARRDDDGAPYIYHLTNVFKEFAETYDLLTMMTMVANKMDLRGVSSNYSTLRKSVYFNP